MIAYARMLSRYEKANVIGTKDFSEILLGHVLDSLSCLIFTPLRGAMKLADIGSGGGLPGVPLAIVMPDAEITLIEATGKKSAFLRYVSEELKLVNVRVVNARVEEVARDEVYRGAHDVCTVRALARLSVIAEYSLPLLRKGGHLVAMKGREDEDERAEGERAAMMLGGRLFGEIPVSQVPEAEQKERRLLLLEKIGETPDRYPRRTGMPVRDPLGKRS
ncbi:MAG: 16S rRNA (guanine(527)-N(7))-methyltransferase [uncultured Rubrobacteraceae bacterium]|uniref:Ribosomal RNA small subunit methyltransferase G n=1 Tax=uncultured Rubrobacteraceae bacterium TaxID=349277 RepID=A0A6J4Q6Z6_9ACTN|nr:MAG: 16S rRNA (guanine(527)-N(7))-methyltransferase [uncultured Rubrobacteraceae bacterium]